MKRPLDVYIFYPWEGPKIFIRNAKYLTFSTPQAELYLENRIY